MNLKNSIRRKLRTEEKAFPVYGKCEDDPDYVGWPRQDCSGKCAGGQCPPGCRCDDNPPKGKTFTDGEECGTGMYWCKKSEKCKPIGKKKRKKEQTTAGAAGAYSQPLFGKPMKRSIKIKESTFIELLEKSVYSARHGGVIKEALTDADERRIGVLARKELKDYEVKLEKKVDQMITKAFKGKEFEDKTLKITKNALIQLYKALWIRRSFWSEYIKNTPS